MNNDAMINISVFLSETVSEPIRCRYVTKHMSSYYLFYVKIILFFTNFCHFYSKFAKGDGYGNFLRNRKIGNLKLKAMAVRWNYDIESAFYRA